MSNKNKEDISIIFWILRRLKNRRLRNKIKWRKFKAKHFSITKKELSLEKERAIELFIALLKSKHSNLNHSPESKARFIESEFAWASMCSAKDNQNYIINIIDESIPGNPHCYEFLIPDERATKVMDIFDAELEKRFKALDVDKKKILVSDINELITKIKNDSNER